MSYQIKSTPYFRRMMNTSKKNGQLQRLREEYERIQEFNERTIEMKMRQVRLKRLFREIEDMKETQLAGPTTMTRRKRRDSIAQFLASEKSTHTRRLETLARSRELGKAMSRRNAELAEQTGGMMQCVGMRMSNKARAAAEAKRQAVERRDRTARRINYGNAQSKSNMEKIVQRKLRHQQQHYSESSSSSFLPSFRSADELNEKRTMLRQRLEYGNSRSYSNMGHTTAAKRCSTEPFIIYDPDLETVHARITELSQSKYVVTNADAVISSTVGSDYDDVERTVVLAGPQKTDKNQLPDFRQPYELCRKSTVILQRGTMQSMSDVDAMLKGSRLAQQRWHRMSLILPWFTAFGRSSTKTPAAKCNATAAPARRRKVDTFEVVESSSYEDLDSTTVIDSSDKSTQAYKGVWKRVHHYNNCAAMCACGHVVRDATAQEYLEHDNAKQSPFGEQNKSAHKQPNENVQRLRKMFEH